MIRSCLSLPKEQFTWKTKEWFPNPEKLTLWIKLSIQALFFFKVLQSTLYVQRSKYLEDIFLNIFLIFKKIVSLYCKYLFLNFVHRLPVISATFGLSESEMERDSVRNNVIILRRVSIKKPKLLLDAKKATKYKALHSSITIKCFSTVYVQYLDPNVPQNVLSWLTCSFRETVALIVI